MTLPVIEGYTLVPVREFEWTDDFSYHRTLTCQNHPSARYSSKNVWQRSIFIVTPPEGDIERGPSGDCTCKVTDLLVMVKQ